MMKTIFTVIVAVVSLVCVNDSAAGFSVPEILRYEINWIGIRAGTSSLRTMPMPGNMVQITSSADSLGWVTMLYPVRDRVESIVERKSPFIPVSYSLKTREGFRRRDEGMWFDFQNVKVRFVDRINEKDENYDIPTEVFDPLSALYKVREMGFEVGKSVFVPIFDSEKVYDLEVEVIKKETITVPAGTFDTILIKPLLQSEGIFSRKGPILTWLSDDERRIPVKMQTSVAIGSLTMELTGIGAE